MAMTRLLIILLTLMLLCSCATQRPQTKPASRALDAAMPPMPDETVPSTKALPAVVLPPARRNITIAFENRQQFVDPATVATVIEKSNDNKSWAEYAVISCQVSNTFTLSNQVSPLFVRVGNKVK
jgi:hypothetical protein